jgi:creatinine amidohydrolase
LKQTAGTRFLNAMTRKRSPHDWADLDWGALATGDASRLIAVLPLAATEQHGPHLPLGTDVMIADAYLARVRKILPQASPARFLPMQPVGISTEHIDFPGTLTLSSETALQCWLAIGDSVARAGVRKLVIVTSHGGNSAAMSLVAQDLRARHGMLAVTTSWSRFGVPDGLFTPEEIRHGVHGGAIETSIMLAAWPDHVRADKIATFTPSSVAMDRDFKWLNAHRPAPFAWAAQDLHPSGAAGDATQASAEKGRAILDRGARAFCELLLEVERFELKQSGNQ